jgi:hypothetical protein
VDDIRALGTLGGTRTLGPYIPVNEIQKLIVLFRCAAFNVCETKKFCLSQLILLLEQQLFLRVARRGIAGLEERGLMA